MAHHYHPDGLPVMLWIDFRGLAEPSWSSLFTVGMSEFGLMELEVPQSQKRLGDLREFAWDIAAYLIRQGPVVGDGQTVGWSETEQFVVRHTPSMIDRAGTVYTIEGL